MKPLVLIELALAVWLLYSAIANKQPLGVLANAVGYTSSSATATASTADTSPTASTDGVAASTTPTSQASNVPAGVNQNTVNQFAKLGFGFNSNGQLVPTGPVLQN